MTESYRNGPGNTNGPIAVPASHAREGSPLPTRRLVPLLALVSLLGAPPALAQSTPPATEGQFTTATKPADAAAPAAAPATPAATATDAIDVAALKARVDALAKEVAETKKGLAPLQRLRFSGYVQARWEWLEAARYNGTPGVAPPNDNFYIRRARFKAVYDADWSQYVLQIDALPRGVTVKEAFVTLKLPKGLAVDAGLQLLPFGWEVPLRSSADLDLLERALVSDYYVGGQYDLGVALSGAFGVFNFKVGLFNGNGTAAWAFANASSGFDNDQRKDVIGRLGLDFGMVTGGVSGWWGKTINYGAAGDPMYDRYRVGGDLQVYLKLLPFGATSLKGEYIWGRTGLGNLNNGAGLALGQSGHGWYALVTQNVGPWNQLAARWDEFTPNNNVNISAPTSTTVKTTQQLSLALHTFVGQAFKFSFAWYDPMNGAKGAAAPDSPKAQQFVVQAQAKF